MKIHEIIAEAPMMVPQEGYPVDFEEDAIEWLRDVNANPSELKEKYRSGDVRIMSLRGVHLFLFVKNVAVGMMHLVDARNLKTIIGKRAWQVMNVYVTPEYRNQRLGTMLYDYVLHHRNHAFASGASMTPSSRRIYTSKLLKDSSVDVYALVRNYSNFKLPSKGELWSDAPPNPKSYERVELHAGPNGVTTGDPHADTDATFVMVAHK